MTTSCPRCRQCLAISTQSRCRPPPGKSFMMANAIRIDTYADRAAKTARLKQTLRGRQDLDTIGLSSNSYIVADAGTRAPGGLTKIIHRGVAASTPGVS